MPSLWPNRDAALAVVPHIERSDFAKKFSRCAFLLATNRLAPRADFTKRQIALILRVV
jgi:hypothetical protein